MKLYELTYLIFPNLAGEEIKNLQEKMISVIQKEEGDFIENGSATAKIHLAYPIKKQKEAYLNTLTFRFQPEKLPNLEKEIRSEKKILRYILLIKEVRKEIPKVFIPSKKPIPARPKEKVELKEIDKKLEEILSE